MLKHITHLSALAALLAVTVTPVRADEFDKEPINYRTAAADNAVSKLQERIDAGKAKLTFEERFGYLRSDFPDDPSSESQADAFVDLLDHLGIERVPIIGGSAGAFLSLSPLRNVRVPLPRGRSPITDDLLDARTLGSPRAPNAEEEPSDPSR